MVRVIVCLMFAAFAVVLAHSVVGSVTHSMGKVQRALDCVGQGDVCSTRE